MEMKGICAASITPFKKNDETKIDEKAYAEHIDYLLDAGVPTILVNAGTGEFPFLLADEKKWVAEWAPKYIRGRAAVMVQTSAQNTTEAIDFSKHAEDNGADGLLVLPPYFEGPTEEGVFRHYEAVSNAVNIPIVCYNIPSCSDFAITPDFFKRLKEIKNIRFIKDTSFDYLNIRRWGMLGDGKIKPFNGVDAYMFEALVAGCVGGIWGGANVMPKEGVKMYELVQAGKIKEAKELWEGKMLAANMFFASHPYNPSIKAAMRIMGRDAGDCRFPVQPLSAEEIRELEAALEPLKM